jgi:predicted  nucleic acid-binding Zn-ribbon protein
LQETISALESEVAMLRSDILQQKATAAAREAALEHESAGAKESLQIIEREVSDLKRQLHAEVHTPRFL